MKKIAIIGGGPVGLACAAWLLEKIPGTHLDLYDRLPESNDAIKMATAVALRCLKVVTYY